MGAAENRQIVADAYAAFGQGHSGAVINSLTDDVVWTKHPAAAPTSGEFHSKDGARRLDVTDKAQVGQAD
jgi:ketosteroid isomerase-like protein